MVRKAYVVAGLAAAALFGGSVQTSDGAIVVTAHYRLGEDDAGATDGGTGAAVTIGRTASGISSPTLDLTRQSSPTYTSSLSATAIAKGSTLGLSVVGGSGYTRGTSFATTNNNFGLEAWFKWNSGSGVIAVNGDSGGSGFAILVDGGNYKGLYGGVAFLDSGVAADTNWHHLALVRDSGTSRMYLDGTQIGGTFANTPNTPTSGFGIGRNNSNTAGFNGAIDEVRVFTFTPGQFSTSDLLINQASIPEPTTIGLLGTVATATLLRRRRTTR